jgi:hypothetical protein
MLDGKHTKEQRVDEQGLSKGYRTVAVNGSGETEVAQERDRIEKRCEKQEIAQGAVAERKNPFHGASFFPAACKRWSREMVDVV